MATSSGDVSWDGLRGVLMIGGSLVAGYFGMKQEDVATLVDNIVTFGSSGVAIASFIWMIYVKFRTKAVPIDVVLKSQSDPIVPTIPTVSPITGAVKIGDVT